MYNPRTYNLLDPIRIPDQRFVLDPDPTTASPLARENLNNWEGHIDSIQLWQIFSYLDIKKAFDNTLKFIEGLYI